MSSPNGGDRPYRVHFTAATSIHFKKLQEIANRLGFGHASLAAAKAIIYRLETRPGDFGEALTRSRH